MQAHVCTSKHVHTYARMHAYIHACTDACTPARMHTHARTHARMHAYADQLWRVGHSEVFVKEVNSASGFAFS